jgi:hypothetical protein
LKNAETNVHATQQGGLMGTFAGTTFGIGAQGAYPVPGIGFSPYAGQGFGLQSFAQQPYGTWPGSQAIGGAPPVQQILQLLQIVPQQLQQLQMLQQHQLMQLQQLLQLVPAQLQQLQQLIQVVPQQVQHLQQQGQPFGPAISGPLGFGLTPQVFGPGAGHVM